MADDADTAQALMDRAVADGDPRLAEAIGRFARSREYGLVFEHNRPEAMRLYGKPIKPGDLVNVLPERGKREEAGNRVPWLVGKIEKGTAMLRPVGRAQDSTGGGRTVGLSDVVAVCEPGEPIYPGLRETGRVERGGGSLGDPGGKPYHVVINAENYHALQALGFCYAGRVDCVYIDPPYNTGAKDWKYNNDYVGNTDAYRHSKWLAWMERRLQLAKKLLNPDNSVLVCTIDEKEYLRLGLLLEQTFPEARIQMVSSIISRKGSSRGNEFYRTNEYLYFIMLGDAQPIALELSGEWLGVSERKTTRTGLQWTSLMRSGAGSARQDRPRLFYPIYVSDDEPRIVSAGPSLAQDADYHTIPDMPGCHTLWPIHSDGSEGRWQLSQPALEKACASGFVKLGKTNAHGGMAVSFLRKGEREKIEKGLFPIIGHRSDGSIIVDDSAYRPKFVPGTQWNITSHDASAHGSTLLGNLLGGKRFPYPKSLYAVEDALRFFIGGKPNAIVLDFFAGSGTTAHAVMRLNHEDGGRRISLSVTNNEVSAAEERELTAAGLRHGDADWEKHGICRDVTIPRIRAAITGRTPQNQPIKGDYRFTDTFPMADGFNENAVFFDLIYQDPYQVELRRGFQAIAPLLWMRAGCRGPIIRKENNTYAIADTYAVLFHWSAVNAFIKRLEEQPEAKTVYVVTDDPTQYTRLCGMLPDRDVIRLYRSYLESFKIASEGAVD